MTNDPIEIIKDDHKAVEKLFKEYEDLDENDASYRRGIADRIIEALTVHAEMEEALCYPRFKAALDEKGDAMVEEAYVEHEGAKNLLADLAALSPDEPKFDASMKVLMEQIRHHVKEEEHDLLPKAKKAVPEAELETMGNEMRAFKEARGTTN